MIVLTKTKQSLLIIIVFSDTITLSKKRLFESPIKAVGRDVRKTAPTTLFLPIVFLIFLS